ncbi:unnamed protein product [Closterium sp. NIES-54]
MASHRVLGFDHEGCTILFETWLDDLQLYLLSDSSDSVLLFDHMSGAAPAPPATGDSATRSQWLTRDAAAHLAIRNHLPLAECAHFGQHRTAQAMYNAVVARYSLPATAALGRLLLPYLFPELSAFATVEDLVSHLHTSVARYRAAAPAEDHFLSLDPTVLTIDLLEQHLHAAETSVVAVGAARGTPRTPFFEGCSPTPLAPSYASAAAVDVPGARAVEVVAAVGVVVGVGALVAVVEAAVGVAGGCGSGGSGGGRAGAQRGGSGGGQRQQQQRRSETPSPQQLQLLRSGVAIFDLDYDAILSAMHALSISAEGDCYRCVPPDPGIAAAALGASESSLLGTAPAEALHTFTLDSGASRCFFGDSTTLTPLPALVPVRLADLSGGPVVASSSTVLPCPAVPSGSLSGLHLPSFSTNLVSTAALQDSMVTTTTLEGQRVLICMCTRTGHRLATFTRRPRSSLYTLTTELPQVAASTQASASGQIAPPCSCHLLTHQTLLWHHCLGHPSLPRLRGMHSRLLVSGLPRSLPPLPPLPAPPCLPCVEGRQRAAPHSSLFPPTTAPLQTLHVDVWGPARVSGQGRERYFLLVVDDYTRYTTVFPLCSKGEVPDVLIPWIRTVRLQLGERSDFLSCVCILTEVRRIGIVMEVSRTSMIHAVAPQISVAVCGPVCCASTQPLAPCLLSRDLAHAALDRGVGDATVFRVWGSRAFVRDTSADKLSARAIPCDVTFDKSIPFYYLFPYRSASPPPPLLFLAPGPPQVDPLPPQGPAPSSVSQVDPLPGTVPVEVGGDSGAARGATSGGVASGGAEPGGADSEGAGSGGAEPRGAEPKGADPRGAEIAGVEPGGAEPEGVEPGGAAPKGVEPGGAESEGAESGGAGPRGNASAGGPAGASPRLSPWPEPLSPQQLRKWFAQRTRLRSGAVGAGDPAAGDTRAGGARGAAAAGFGGARTKGTGAAGTGGVGGAGAGDPTELGAAEFGGTGAGGFGVVDPRAGGAVAGGSSTALAPPLLCPPPLQPASPLPSPSPYSEQTGGLTERCEPASRPASPVCTSRCIPRSCPPPVPGTHAMALCPSSVPLRVPLLAPPESSLPIVPDPESDRARAASPTVSRLLATVVTDPAFKSTAVSSLVAKLLDFAATCRLHYATALVAESGSASPPSIGGDLDAPDIPTLRSYAEAITGTYVDEVPPSGVNIVDGMWIFRVKRPPGSPPAFKARYVARGFSQRQGVDYFQTFSPTPKMTTLLWRQKGDVHKRMWQILVLPWWKSGKAAAATSMEESVTEEEQQGVQGDELTGGSAAVKALATSGQAGWETWHLGLAHVAVSTLEVMQKEKCVHWLQLQGDGAHYGSCEACMQNKFVRFPFPRAEGLAKASLEVVHMNLVGPMRTEGTGGVLYFLTMVDECSSFTWARPLSKKSDAAAAIKEDWLPMVEWQAMRLVKVLRSDRGGEFLGAEFTKFLKRNGIGHQLTCPGTPQHNGIAEHANRTIGEAAKTLLGAAGMPYKFWPDAVRHVITVKNRVLMHVGDKHWVVYERWLGKKPCIDMLRVWGCMGLVMVPKEQRHKLEVAAVWAVHLGMAPDSKGCDHSGGGEQQDSGPAAEEGLEDESSRVDSPSQLEPAATAKVTKRSVQKGASPHGQQTATREKRVASPPSRIKYSHLGGPKQCAMAVQADEGEEEEMAFCFFTPLPGELATVEEALSGPQKEEWSAAMDVEFNSLIENGTWELVELPEGRRPINSKWVFKVKSGADGALEWFKSRLVAKGFQQKEKADFKEIFAPIVKLVTLRTMLAGAAVKGWHVK